MPRLPRIKTRLFGTLLLGVSLLALIPASAYADIASPAVTDIGSVHGGQVWDVTDGGVVVGEAYITGGTYYAYRWTQAGGMANLGTFGGTYSEALREDADGSVVVGDAYLTGNSADHAFRWTQAGGMADLGTLGGNASSSWGVSADGSVVVGGSNITGNSATHAFRWTQAGGMVDLGTIGGGYSSALNVSDDGSVVVGASDPVGLSGGLTQAHAFRWTQAGGMVDLGTFGGVRSEPFDVSADGSVVVGGSNPTGTASFGTFHAFVWTQAGGLADLGTLGGTYSISFGVSANGSVVVGDANLSGNSATHAFRWTQASGMQDLNTLLRNAGVNMTGITLNDAAAISSNGRYIAGVGAFPTSSSEAYLVTYMDATTNPPVTTPVITTPIAGVTTAATQQAATQALSANQRASLIESRSTANEMLGFTRPMNNTDYTYAGGMFGSAVGYTGGQYAENGMTVLGGIAYGAQDYPGISQSDAPTVAAAARYTFDVPFDEKRFFHPFVELGGSVTPQAGLTLSRTYANGAGTSTGTGSTQATSWAEYGRLGMVWNMTGYDQFTGYGEIGQQDMAFNAYSETLSSTNPFPASVSAGVLRLDVARAGASWTHRFDALELNDDLAVPISFTLAGAAAHAINEHAGLTASVSGVGVSTAANQGDTWGEFGGRIESQLTDRVALDLDLTGTTGSGALDTVLHGGAGLTYRF
jgi:probable HAF family extracellular repeat protein